MSNPLIRPLVICVFRHGTRILVNEAEDPVKGESYFRPLGGGIEFGETSAQALVRELREEIGADVTDLRLLGTLENIFTYRGQPGHEIVLVYDGQFVNASLYTQSIIPGAESDGSPFQATWRELASFSDARPLYPVGLLELLRAPSEH
ncbi:MAG: NUDIX hydrolase [Candidatus Sericytochromatia bacterium]